MTNSHYKDDTEALLKGTFMCPCILFNAALKVIRAFTEQLQVHLLRFENILVCLLCCIASIHRIEQALLYNKAALPQLCIDTFTVGYSCLCDFAQRES